MFHWVHRTLPAWQHGFTHRPALFGSRYRRSAFRSQSDQYDDAGSTEGQFRDLFRTPLHLYGNQPLEGKRARADGEGLPGNSGFRKFAKGSFFGFLAGVITATFGTSGAAPVQAGLFAMHLPIKLVVGTSLFVVLFNTFSALGAHFLVGEIDLTLVVLLASGAALGALSGPKLLSSVNIDHAEGPVRFWYAMAMAAFGIAMIITR